MIHKTQNRSSRSSNTDYQIVRKRVASLKPSPENTQIYRHVDDDDRIDNLEQRIRQNGCDPLVVTGDGYIVSGHRRHAVLMRIGKVWVQCRVLPIRRDSMPADEYIVLLRSYNEQRDKTVAEKVRETLIDIDPNDAYASLVKARNKSIFAAERNGIRELIIEGSKKRHVISDDKSEHVKLIKQIVESLKKWWPLSCRGVHYPLLNFEFVRGFLWPHKGKLGHGKKQVLWYRNDDGSYDATCDLITRMRLNGKNGLEPSIPFEAFDDPTRPLREFHPFNNVREFISQEVDGLFTGYWRNLLQSQPNYIEVFCEKNTVYHMVLRVTEKYQIPTSSGRGFNGIDPWHDLYLRYRKSGKKRLIVIVMSDYDPEGEMIAQVGGRTLRDDFGVPNFSIIKAGVTRQQIIDCNLPKQNFAKETSSNRPWFVKRNNGDDSVYELEALEPQIMLDDLENVIKSVIDTDLFNAEVAAEREEAPYLEGASQIAKNALKGLAE